MTKLTILLALPNRLLRESLTVTLEQQLAAQVFPAANSEEVFHCMNNNRPAVLLIDTDLPGINAKEIIKHVSVYCPPTRTLAICALERSDKLKVLMKARAHGCLSYNSSLDVLFAAIRQVAGGGEYFTPAVQKILNDKGQLAEAQKTERIVALTRKEIQVASLVKEGLTTRAIASLMGLSVSTIEIHRYHILRKLKMKRSTSLINYLSS